MLVIQRPTVEAIGEAEGNRQRFAVSPLEPGFGHTLGNSLRRTLLSSIPGAAITQLRFDDALHEFDTIAGVTEDVTDIILNLKDLVLVCHSDEPVTLRLDAQGPGRHHRRRHRGQRATSRSSTPSLHIATLNKSARLAIDITVSKGRGYVSADRNKCSQTIGVIPVDSIFSPVRRVAFQIEPTRVEQSTDYDRLVLDIETDGSISPREALASAGDTLRSLVGLVAEMSDDPQGLELGEVATTTAGSPDLDLPDRGPRPLRAPPQLPQAGAGQHDRRAPAEDRGRPAGHHELRPEVARRGHPEARRARPVAAHEGLGARHARHPEEGPSLRRQLPAPAADDGQPRRVARRRRGHRHHRGQGQGAAPRRREGHHQGQEGRPPQPPPGRLVPRRQGDGPQALHRDRARATPTATAATPAS